MPRLSTPRPDEHQVHTLSGESTADCDFARACLVPRTRLTGAIFGGILFKTHLLGWDWYDMPVYRMAITSTQKHQCPSKGTPWALCTQPRSAVWGYFTPVLLIIHTSGTPYFHKALMYISVTDWSRFQCHLSALGVDLCVLGPHR